MLTPVESLAHIRILDVIARRRQYAGKRHPSGQRSIRNKAADEQLLLELDRLLPVFAPRCVCGLPLRAEPTIGMTRWSCGCGHSFREAI